MVRAYAWIGEWLIIPQEESGNTDWFSLRPQVRAALLDYLVALKPGYMSYAEAMKAPITNAFRLENVPKQLQLGNRFYDFAIKHYDDKIASLAAVANANASAGAGAAHLDNYKPGPIPSWASQFGVPLLRDPDDGWGDVGDPTPPR